jgi:hypothetical protein
VLDGMRNEVIKSLLTTNGVRAVQHQSSALNVTDLL